MALKVISSIYWKEKIQGGKIITTIVNNALEFYFLASGT